MENQEDVIKENLAKNLHLINPEFTLIDTEHYIPESKTTKSFIDILAKDNDHNYIIIEVKRSNQSARQAIHEIYKYTEAIKEKYKVKTGEIKAIIISTEWKELYIPFSTFANDSNISIDGYELFVDSNLHPIKIEKVIPCKTNKGRVFSPIQECCLYLNEENLEKGIKSHIDIYEEKGIFDYVLLILKGAEFNTKKYKKDLELILSQITGSDETNFEGHFDSMEIYPLMIYSAYQRLSTDEYYEILKRDKTEYDETKEYIEYCGFKDEDDILSVLENNILGNLKPWFYSDSTEIGYPAKFAYKIIEDEKWEIVKMIRSPSLQKNKLLSDEKIISEIKGLSGITNSILKENCKINHKAKFIEIQESTNSVLKYNAIWKNHLKYIFEEISSFREYDLEINILDQNNILMSMIHMVTNKNSLDYLPFYSLEIKKGNETIVYLGSFSWNNKKPDLNKLVKNHFDNDARNIIMTMAWGISETDNESILNDLGLSYETYKIDKENQLYIFKNYKFKKVEKIKNGVIDLLNSNYEFVRILEAIHNAHHHQAKIDFSK